MSDFLLSSVTPSQSVSTNSVMTQQQQSTSIPEKDEIWSSILKSVASTKMVPTKNVLILGKTTCCFLLFGLLEKEQS